MARTHADNGSLTGHIAFAATARPIPREAPLITATLFESFNLFYFQSAIKMLISLF